LEEVAGVTGLEPATFGVPARFARYLMTKYVTPITSNTAVLEEVAGVTGLEPATFGVPARFARYLMTKYVTPITSNTAVLEEVAGVTGLEPATFGVTGRRSNQLSYTPARGAVDNKAGMVGDDRLELPTLSV
jgi:hypothetical protein